MSRDLDPLSLGLIVQLLGTFVTSARLELYNGNVIMWGENGRPLQFAMGDGKVF